MRAFISAILFAASAFFASMSFPEAEGRAGDGATAGELTEPFGLEAANFALTAAILAIASCFFLSKSDIPFVDVGAGAGEPLAERIRFASS